jgi:hypothetical protein
LGGFVVGFFVTGLFVGLDSPPVCIKVMTDCDEGQNKIDRQHLYMTLFLGIGGRKLGRK